MKDLLIFGFQFLFFGYRPLDESLPNSKPLGINRCVYADPENGNLLPKKNRN